MFSGFPFSAAPFSSLGDSLVPTVIVYLSGTEAIGLVGTVLVWGLVGDGQPVTWQPVDDSQSGSWVEVSDAQAGVWGPVDSSQSGSWTPVDDSNDVEWDEFTPS